MLCLLKSSLRNHLVRPTPFIQKNLDLGVIVSTAQHFSEDSVPLDCVPVQFAISVRSCYDNTVLQTESAVGSQCFNLYHFIRMCKEEFPHKGYDLIMYLSSLTFLTLVDYCQEVEQVMFQHSQFQPIGLYSPDPDCYNPVVYSHIILSDEGMKLLTPHLKPGVKCVTIDSMKPRKQDEVFTRTIFNIQKEETFNE